MPPKNECVKLSCVIPSVDRQKLLLNLLINLEYQTFQDYEIIVVEQSRILAEEIIDYIDKSKGKVRLIRSQIRSLPNARNIGIQNAKSDIILFIDDDIQPDKNLFYKHYTAYSDSNISAVGGRITGGYDRGNSFNKIGELRNWDAKVIRNFHRNIKCDVKHLPGGNMSFRKIVFDKIGGFDLLFGGSSVGEETDLCLRAYGNGFKLIFLPDASLVHFHVKKGGVHNINFKEWLYWHAHNLILFSLRHIPLHFLVPITLLRIVRFFMFAFEYADISLVPIGLKGVLGGISSYLKSKQE